MSAFIRALGGVQEQEMKSNSSAPHTADPKAASAAVNTVAPSCPHIFHSYNCSFTASLRFLSLAFCTLDAIQLRRTGVITASSSFSSSTSSSSSSSAPPPFLSSLLHLEVVELSWVRPFSSFLSGLSSLPRVHSLLLCDDDLRQLDPECPVGRANVLSLSHMSQLRSLCIGGFAGVSASRFRGLQEALDKGSRETGHIRVDHKNKQRLPPVLVSYIGARREEAVRQRPLFGYEYAATHSYQ